MAISIINGVNNTTYTVEYNKGITYSTNGSMSDGSSSSKIYYVNITLPAGGTWLLLAKDVMGASSTAGLKLFGQWSGGTVLKQPFMHSNTIRGAAIFVRI